MFAKTALAATLMTALSAGLAGAADAPAAPAATTAALTALYQVGCNAALDPTDKNLDADAALLAPDYVDIDAKGKETKRDESIAMMKQNLKLYHSTDCKVNVGTVTAPDDKTAVATTTLHVVGDVQAPDGKHDFDVTAKSEDTWKLINGAWLQVKSRTLHQVVKVDGSVVQEQGQ